MDEYLFERDLTLAKEKFMQSGGPGVGLISPASSRSVRRLRGGSFDGIWTFFLNKNVGRRRLVYVELERNLQLGDRQSEYCHSGEKQIW